MSLAAFFAFVAAVPASAWASIAAGLGLKSLLGAALKCWLDGRAAVKLQRIKNEGEQNLAALRFASELKQLGIKYEHEASERENERQHERKKWKHEKALALINAPPQSTGSSVMAVA